MVSALPSDAALYGYKGKILHVDLTKGKFIEQALDAGFARRHLGGNGFAARIAFDRIEPRTEPYSPENVLVFATGPVNGSRFPCSDRYCVATKSPLTGLFFDSYSGGGFASALKACYDAVAVYGRAAKPVYLYMDENTREIRDAKALWGEDTVETQARLSERHGKDAESVCIGPAGEKRVRYACVISHERAAGRGGIGAVMGAKNLKAFVARGNAASELYDEHAFDECVSVIRERIKTHPTLTNLRDYGTPVVTALTNEMRALGTKNWQFNQFEHAEAISAERFKQSFVKRSGCKRCPIACGKVMSFPDGHTAKAPEYETIFALGPNLLCSDIYTVGKANELCNLYGLDTISTGGALGFAMECTERGIGAFELRWGDTNVILETITLIARRKGIGNVLAKGVKHMSETLNGTDTAEFAVHVKGLELPGYDPRTLTLMALGFATSTRGGSHQDTRPFFCKPNEVTAENVHLHCISCENRTALQDSLITCRFLEQVMGMTVTVDYLTLVNALTGFALTLAELTMIGERIYNIERLFNVREGAGRDMDTLPARFRASLRFDPDVALDRYYRRRGWSADGVPRASTTRRLGLLNRGAERSALGY